MTSWSVSVNNSVATLTLQQPAISNAIDIGIIRSIHLALDQI
jgi:enoyl-CoA hydratase/carnithine racemase